MTTRRRWTRRLSSAGIGAAALLLVGGIAYAAWHALGAGTGAAGSGTTQALGVTATVSGSLHPGGVADLLVTVSNPNSSAVTVTSLALAGSVAASAGCTTPGVTVTLPGSTNLVVPAGGNGSLTVTNGVGMTTSSTSDCQGATFTIPLQATGRLP